jgi:hypothetical protein
MIIPHACMRCTPWRRPRKEGVPAPTLGLVDLRARARSMAASAALTCTLATPSRQTKQTSASSRLWISTLTINNNPDRQAPFAETGIADKNDVLHLGGSTSNPRLSEVPKNFLCIL